VARQRVVGYKRCPSAEASGQEPQDGRPVPLVRPLPQPGRCRRSPGTLPGLSPAPGTGSRRTAPEGPQGRPARGDGAATPVTLVRMLLSLAHLGRLRGSARLPPPARPAILGGWTRTDETTRSRASGHAPYSRRTRCSSSAWLSCGVRSSPPGSSSACTDGLPPPARTSILRAWTTVRTPARTHSHREFARAAGASWSSAIPLGRRIG